MRIFFLLFVISFNLLAKNIVDLKAIRIWPSPYTNRIVFDANRKLTYKINQLSNPSRLVVDLENTKFNSKLPVLNDKNKETGIKNIRMGKHYNKLRFVFDLEQKVEIKDFMLLPSNNYGHRLVLDFSVKNKKVTKAKVVTVKSVNIKKVSVPKTIAPRLNKKFTVAIDAGHGGEDPGAIGPKGTYEKNVVLAIAKELNNMISKNPKMSSVMIRKGDYYVGLRERMEIARKSNADLFISIHADAVNNKVADGASVYILSEKGASSEAAKWLAEKENRADLVGGISLDNKGDMLASVLLDLSQTASDAASLKAAENILKSIGKDNKLLKTNVERAAFAVLKAPDVPSVLVETGFISNPKTEKKLRTKQYQQKIAKSIMQGIEKYAKN